jgi:LysM repeat protein
MIKKLLHFSLIAVFLLPSISCSVSKSKYKPIKFSTKEEQKISSTSEILKPTKNSPSYSEKHILYEVLVTDTIASVARKYHISADAIINYNSLKKPYILKPGQMLKIPQLSNREDDLISSLDSLENNEKRSKLIQIAPKE